MKFASITNLFKKKEIKISRNKSVAMSYAFTGLSGKKYFHYIDAVNDMNPARYIEYYLPMVKEYFLGLKNSELNTFFSKCKEYNTLQQYQSAHLVMQERAKLNLDAEIIYDIMSVLYLREDEDNKFVDQLFLRDKSKDIRQTMQSNGGVDDGFFSCPEFRKFLESANILETNWSQYTVLAEKNIKILEETLNLIRNVGL